MASKSYKEALRRTVNDQFKIGDKVRFQPIGHGGHYVAPIVKVNIKTVVVDLSGHFSKRHIEKDNVELISSVQVQSEPERDENGSNDHLHDPDKREDVSHDEDVREARLDQGHLHT